MFQVSTYVSVLCLHLSAALMANKDIYIVQVRSNICSICQQASECPMRRTMLAAVQATAKRLIAPRYLMGQNNVCSI